MLDTERDQEPLERALSKRIQPFRQFRAPGQPQPPAVDLTLPGGTAVHPLISSAVVAALEAGETHYTTGTGIARLRAAIAAQSALQGFPSTGDTVVVTNGGSEALFITLQTLVARDDSVVLFDPCSEHLETLVRFIGGVPERASSPEESDLDGAAIVVVSQASGISGRLLDDSILETLLNDAARHGVTVILDRSNVPNCYVELSPFLRPDLTGETITIGSFSGAYGLAGWRAGYFTAPEHLIPRLAGLKESMSISTTTPTQFAMLAALEHDDEILGAARGTFASRRDLAMSLLQQHGLQFEVPAIYPGLLIDLRDTGQDDVDIATRLATNAGVRVEAGSLYGESLSGRIRIDLRSPQADLEEGIQRIAAFLGGDL
jgi:arginine:pyruvate transaminase